MNQLCGLCKINRAIPSKPYCVTCLHDLRFDAAADQARAMKESMKNEQST
jgi:hypothetical protein